MWLKSPYHFFFGYFLFFTIPLLSAQDSTDIKKYFDDGGVSKMKNVVKITLSNPIFGELAVLGERNLLKWLNVEAGFGAWLPYRGLQLFNSDLNSFRGGFNLQAQARLYWRFQGVHAQHGTEGVYFCLQTRKSWVNAADEDKYKLNDYFIGTGVQYGLTDRLLLDAYWAIGGRWIAKGSVLDAATLPQGVWDSNLLYLFSLRLGFSF